MECLIVILFRQLQFIGDITYKICSLNCNSQKGIPFLNCDIPTTILLYIGDRLGTSSSSSSSRESAYYNAQKYKLLTKSFRPSFTTHC